MEEMGGFEEGATADPERQQSINQLKEKLPPSAIKDFAIVAFSLMAQSHYKVMEIQMILKQYEQHHSLGLNNFTPEHLKQAFDNDGKYWITHQEACDVARFLDPHESGTFSAKHLVDLLNKDELTSLIQNFNMNNSVFLAALLDGLEYE